MKDTRIISAKVLHDYVVEIKFMDKTSIIDFKPVLDNDEWYFGLYRGHPRKFKRDMRVEFNVLAFGDTWHLHFDPNDLYDGNIIPR
jgi:hypothetical protein